MKVRDYEWWIIGALGVIAFILAMIVAFAGSASIVEPAFKIGVGTADRALHQQSLKPFEG